MTEEEHLLSQFPLTAKVLESTYVIKSDGSIDYRIRTNKDHYIKRIKNISDHLCTKLYQYKLYPYEQILIHISELENTYIFSFIPNDPNREEGFDLDKLTICPVCGSPLTIINKIPFCMNNDCTAKLLYSVRKYLEIATLEDWSISEIMIFDKLVTTGRIKKLSDIYTLTVNEINSSGVWLNKIERYIGSAICDKLDRTRGTITLVNFLLSFNVPHDLSYWYLDIEKLEKTFLCVEDFIDDMLADIQPNPKVLQCMNEHTYNIIHNYLSQDSNIESIIDLIKEGIFDS